jgi:hypothetical protein
MGVRAARVRRAAWMGRNEKRRNASYVVAPQRTGWDSNPRYAMNVHTLSRRGTRVRNPNKMSSYHYDGTRMSCTPFPYVRICPGPTDT